MLYVLDLFEKRWEENPITRSADTGNMRQSRTLLTFCSNTPEEALIFFGK